MEQFRMECWLPASLDKVFAFFADARNLQELTPNWLHFQLLTPGPFEMKEGLVIDYQLRLHGFPLRWQSEITVWQPPRLFVDEQRRGPYRYWRHEHHFAEDSNGTLVRDEVRYLVPGGRWVNRLFVEPDLQRIFAWRESKLRERFAQ